MSTKRKFTVRRTDDGFALEEYTRHIGEPRGRRYRVFVTFGEMCAIAKNHLPLHTLLHEQEGK